MQKKLMYGMMILTGMGLNLCIKADTTNTHVATGLSYDEILFVNMTDAMLLSAQGKEAQLRVEAEERRYSELAQKEQQRMMQLKNELDTKASMLNAETRRKMEKELNDMQRDFQNKMQDWKYEMQYVMQKETEIMIKDIEQTAKMLAEQSGKAAIADAQTGRILYLREDKNSTSALVALMDTQHTIKLAQQDKAAQSTVVASKDGAKKSATA